MNQSMIKVNIEITNSKGKVTMLFVLSHYRVLLMFILLFLGLTYHFVLIFTSPAPKSLCRHLLLTLELNLALFWSKATPSSIMSYQIYKVFKELFNPPLDFLECTKPACTTHTGLLKTMQTTLCPLSLIDSGCCCFPCSAPSPRKLQTGWNDGAAKLKEQSVSWHNVWIKAGCPSAGVLSSIKKESKKCFKYEVHYLRRRQQHYSLHIYIQELLTEKEEYILV